MGLLARIFPKWRRAWTITIAGVRRYIEVTWDTSLSGGGAIVIDGRTAVRWTFGVKAIATSRAFVLDGIACEVRKGPGTFGKPDLELFVAGIPQRPEEG